MPDPVLLPRRQFVLGVALGGIAGAVVPVLGQAGSASTESVEALKAMLDSYEKAFSAHDVSGVLKVFAPNAIVVGTGPGEIWGGTKEITAAYSRFFEQFDPGKQTSQALFRDGHVLGDMAWLVSMSKVSFTKGANLTEFGLNLSVVFEKIDGKWLVRALHLSNLSSAAPGLQ